MAQSKENIVRTGLRMDAALHQALTEKLNAIRYETGQRVSIDAAIESALREWLAKDEISINKVLVPSTASAVGKYTVDQPPELQEWAAVLFEVLESGHLIATYALLQNLWAFRLLIARDRKGIKRGKSAIPSPSQFAERAPYLAEALDSAEQIAGEIPDREGVAHRVDRERATAGAGDSNGETGEG